MTRKDILTKKHLRIIMIVDRSGSMVGEPIAQVNAAMGPLKKKLCKAAEENNVEVEIKVIVFNDKAHCVVGSESSWEKLGNFTWQEISAEGGTSTPKALKIANESLRLDGEEKVAHMLAPVVILLTDGACNPDEIRAYKNEIERMKGKLSGNTGKEKVIRIGISVGADEKDKMEQIADFASIGKLNDEDAPLIFKVDHAEKLATVINWVTVTSLHASMLPGQDDAFDMGDVEDMDEEWITEEDMEEA